MEVISDVNKDTWSAKVSESVKIVEILIERMFFAFIFFMHLFFLEI